MTVTVTESRTAKYGVEGQCVHVHRARADGDGGVAGTGPMAGGTSVTVTGTGFWGTPTVTFGGAACTSVNRSSVTSLTCTTPAAAAPGPVTVAVTNPDAKSGSLNDAYTYFAPPPTISGVAPENGPMAGGTSVTVTGTGFWGTPTVTFGGAPCTALLVTSNSSLTCVVPPSAVSGPVTVTITNEDGKSASSPGAWSYLVPVTVDPDPTPTPVHPQPVGSISGLKAKRIKKGTVVRLTWLPTTNAVRYEVSCVPKPKKPTAWHPVTARSAKCTRLKPTKSYRAWVRAVGTDSYSGAVSVTVRKWRR